MKRNNQTGKIMIIQKDNKNNKINVEQYNNDTIYKNIITSTNLLYFKARYLKFIILNRNYWCLA